MRIVNNDHGLVPAAQALHAALGRNGLHLVSSEYKLVPSREGQWARVEVSLVIDGPYYAMRLFLRGLMASDAFTALQAADFQRVAASAAAPSVVRCRLTLLLFTAEANHKALPP